MWIEEDEGTSNDRITCLLIERKESCGAIQMGLSNMQWQVE